MTKISPNRTKYPIERPNYPLSKIGIVQNGRCRKAEQNIEPDRRRPKWPLS